MTPDEDSHDEPLPEPKIEVISDEEAGEIPEPGAPVSVVPPAARLEPRLDQSSGAQLNNLHNNVSFRPELLWRLTNTPANGARVTASERRRIGQAAIKILLTQADEHEHLPVRAVGARWSLSRAASTKGWMALTEDLAYTRTSLAELHEDSPYSSSELAWVQCGTRVAQVSANLGQVGRSLLTTGASNGQTIVGATATGTHGSAFHVGSMQDTICGLHIMCSGNRSVWLEPKSAPIVADDVAKKVFGEQVVIIRSDKIFHAAQVSFGSFGFIESVVVKTAPLFLLKTVRYTQKWGDELRAEILGLASKRESNLYHYELTFDPLELATKTKLTPWVTKIYSTSAPQGYAYANAKRPKNVIITDASAVRWASRGARLLPRAMLRQASKMMERRFPLLDGSQGRAPLGVVFTDVVMNSLGASSEIGVALADSVRAANVIHKVLRSSFKRRKPFLGPMAMRFVKASRATLAFTHFKPITCTIELPGARMPWSKKLYREVFAALDDAGIEFALHWGQENDFSPERILKSYGSRRIKSWKYARTRVLNSKMLRDRFSNTMLERCDLD